MSVLDKDYRIKLDIKSGKVESEGIVFADKDRNVSNIYIDFLESGKKVDITGCSFIANIQKPNTLITPQILDIVDALNGVAELNLPVECTIDDGYYEVEIEMKNGEDISHSSKFRYTVREALCGEIDDTIVDDSNYNLLIKLVDNVRTVEEYVQSNEEKRVVNESDRISSEKARVEEHANIMSEIDNKIVDINNSKDTLITNVDNKLNEVDDRVNSAISQGTIDLEVKDARRGLDGKVYSCLAERLNQIENNPMVIWETVEG